MAIYLAKLGREVLPAGTAPLEVRFRFFIALLASLAVALVYWMLRRCFKTSRSAALAGSGLLLFSVIRLDETNIIGPHHLMLACTLAIFALGYQWRNAPTWRAVVGLGIVIAFGALSMTYVIPAVLCWALATGLAGKQWFAWDRAYLKFSWAVPIVLAVAVILLAALWPPAVLRHLIVYDFKTYLQYSAHATLVGNHIFEVTPRSAAVYWLAHLDGPLLVFSGAIILIALWKAFRSGSLSSKHAYVAVFLAFFAATAMAAHIAGARNLLQFIGVLCVAAGALFDEALGYRPRLVRFGLAAVVLTAALNLVWLSRESSYTPYLATDGYRAFLKDNKNLLSEKSKALVEDLPVVKFYAKQDGASLAWDVSGFAWTTRADAPLPADVKYVLMPAYVYEYMPREQPLRRVVADHWKIAWSFKADHVWELRLYENPQLTQPVKRLLQPVLTALSH